MNDIILLCLRSFQVQLKLERNGFKYCESPMASSVPLDHDLNGGFDGLERVELDLIDQLIGTFQLLGGLWEEQRRLDHAFVLSGHLIDGNGVVAVLIRIVIHAWQRENQAGLQLFP